MSLSGNNQDTRYKIQTNTNNRSPNKYKFHKKFPFILQNKR